MVWPILGTVKLVVEDCYTGYMPIKDLAYKYRSSVDKFLLCYRSSFDLVMLKGSTVIGISLLKALEEESAKRELLSIALREGYPVREARFVSLYERADGSYVPRSGVSSVKANFAKQKMIRPDRPENRHLVDEVCGSDVHRDGFGGDGAYLAKMIRPAEYGICPECRTARAMHGGCYCG